MSYDVFISWTGADVKIKEKIAEYLKKYDIIPLLSDEKCQGDFVEWSREAATSAHIFMTIITEHALPSEGMQWELEEIDKKLCSDEKTFWSKAIIPICSNLSDFEQYKSKFSSEGQKMLKSISAIIMETDEDGMLTEKCLKDIFVKTAERIIYHMHTLYCQKTKPDYIKLIPLCDIDAADAVHPFEELYIQRRITETNKNKQEIDSFETPDELLSKESVSFLYGPAGSGKTQYINQIRSCSNEDQIVLSLSCAEVSENPHGLFDIMFQEFRKICGNRGFYTEADFNSLLKNKQLILILDGLDEITTKAATRVFVEKIGTYYKANKSTTTLIFTGRNEKDADVLSFEGVSLRQFRLDKLRETEIEKLSNNLFLLFKEDKGGEFYFRIKELSDEIRTNPLLLSQLAIVYKDRGDIPKTVVGILDAVSKITLQTDKVLHRHLQDIPEKYREMVEYDISGILKSFSRAKYEKSVQGETIESFPIFNDILKKTYQEKGDACRERTKYLLEYLSNRAIFVDGKFYHKMFLEYFTAVSYYEDSFDENCGKIEDVAVITELFKHYDDKYWRDVIKLFLVKADSCIDGETTEMLYKTILSNGGITEYTLLFDVCRELIVHKKEAQLVLVTEILEKSVNGEYPSYGPLFWYVPEYELYEIAVLSAERLLGNAKALALVRDVCFIFGQRYIVSEITDQVDGSKLYESAKRGLSGVRDNLCELFCMGAISQRKGISELFRKGKNANKNIIYPRCFNVAEAEHFMKYGNGICGRMTKIFHDELGLWKEDSYSELGGEYIGFISCKYNKAEMERKLTEKPAAKVRGLALINTNNTIMDYVEFFRASVRVMYIPENTEKIKKYFDPFVQHMLPFLRPKDFDLFMSLELSVQIADENILYIPYQIRKAIFPDGSMRVLPEGFLKGMHFLEEVRLPQGVQEIGSFAFENCEKLVSVTLPESITKIGNHAFEKCVSLNEIKLPDSLTEIEESAFLDCVNLKDILIPDSVLKIGPAAFSGCKSLTEITIPPSVKELSSFSGCINLRNIKLPNSLTKCPSFYGCRSLQSIKIPNSVTKSGMHTFGGCVNLKEIHIPDSVTEIGMNAFEACLNLESVTIPDSITEIKKSVFSGCANLRDIVLPDSLTEIGYLAFWNCTNLRDITIPDSVEEIGAFAFKGCTQLRSICLPESVEVIGNGIFSDCANLKEIVIPLSLKSEMYKLSSSAKIICKETGLPFTNDKSLKEIVVEQGRTEIYEREFAESCVATIVLPDTLETIGKSAFKGCKNLYHITIPDSVTEIEPYAFSGCTALESIDIPDSVEVIGESAFYDCVKLRNIILPNSVSEIGESVFEGCESLCEISIPNSIEEIGDGAFYGCAGLTRISIPSSVKKIGGQAFSKCTALGTISIPNSVTEIGNLVFEGCITLERVIISNLVTKIGSSAFSGCFNLKSIAIPESVTEIGSSAFSGCSNLKSIAIPESVTEIGSCAFSGCSNLGSITIPNSVTEIFGKTFANCTSLQSIMIPSSVKRISGGVFENCIGIRTITIPDSLTQIYKNTFSGCTGLSQLTIPDSVREIEAEAFSDCSSLTVLEIPKGVLRIGDNAFSGCKNLASVTISANFKNDISRIFGNIDANIIKWSNS